MLCVLRVASLRAPRRGAACWGPAATGNRFSAALPPQEWLAKAIHQRGSLDASGDALMVAVTGAPLQPGVFLKHLSSKYSALYKLPA